MTIPIESLKQIVKISKEGGTIVNNKIVCDGSQDNSDSIFTNYFDARKGYLSSALKQGNVFVSEPTAKLLEKDPEYGGNWLSIKDNFKPIPFKKEPYPITDKRIDITLFDSVHTLGSSHVLITDHDKEDLDVFYPSQFREEIKDGPDNVDVLVLDSSQGIQDKDRKFSKGITQLKNIIQKNIVTKSILLHIKNGHLQEIMNELSKEYDDIDFAAPHSTFEQVEIYRKYGYEIKRIMDNNSREEWNSLIEADSHFIQFIPTELSPKEQNDLWEQLEDSIEEKFHRVDILSKDSDQLDKAHDFCKYDEQITIPNYVNMPKTIDFIRKFDAKLILVDNSARTKHGTEFSNKIKDELPNVEIYPSP